MNNLYDLLITEFELSPEEAEVLIKELNEPW